jgi:hypothetical protein
LRTNEATAPELDTIGRCPEWALVTCGPIVLAMLIWIAGGSPHRRRYPSYPLGIVFQARVQNGVVSALRVAGSSLAASTSASFLEMPTLANP